MEENKLLKTKGKFGDDLVQGEVPQVQSII